MNFLANKLPILLIGLFVAFASCNKAEKEKIVDLEKRLAEDSSFIANLNDDMNAINQKLNSVAVLNKMIAEGKVDKNDAIAKISSLDAELTSSISRVDSLKTALDKSKAQAKSLSWVRKALDDKKTELESRISEINALKAQVEQLTAENATIKTENTELKSNLSTKEEQLRELNQKIANAEAQLAAAASEKKSVSRVFFDLGNELRETADKTSKVTNGDKKKELTIQAYCAYKKAKDLGYVDAEREMYKMKEDKEFKKYLEGATCK